MKIYGTAFWLILTTVFLLSCRKEKKPAFDGVNCTGKCYILTGKIIDSAANIGLSNTKVKFYFKNTSGSIFKPITYLGSAITSADGIYDFKFDGSNLLWTNGYYYAEAFKGNLFHDPFYENRFPAFYLDSNLFNIPYVQNFPLFRPATLKIRVIANTVTNFRFLTITYSYGKIGTGIVINGGRPIDTTIVFKTAGDIRTFIQSDAAGNGVNITRKDTVMVNANSTKQVDMRF